MCQCNKLLTPCCKRVIWLCNSTCPAPDMASPKNQRQMAGHRRLSQVESASTIVTMAYDPVGPRNSKIKGLTILSTLDVASGFWTIDLHPNDQHKLAFTFGNRQYTFTRCPFSYANSPAKCNIFLKKACPDARVRDNLVYVGDVLMKSSSVPDKAGTKITRHKGQWCKTKLNFVGLLVRRNGIEPQSNCTQSIQSIKTPTNVSELRSFLGVCNYSRQFIENYTDIARPLTSSWKGWTLHLDGSPGHSYEPVLNSACALPRALPSQIQENNYIWTLDSLISASAQAYTSSFTNTSEWSLMPAKCCFPQNTSIQTAKSFALHCVGHPVFL